MVSHGGLLSIIRKGSLLLLTASMATLGAASEAAVVGSSVNGFEVRESVHVAASAAQAYAAFLLPARWWSSGHTFSGNAANLSLDARAGGCWCETLPDGGFVQHLTVVYAAPGKLLRLRGALGPFQSLGVDGALTFAVNNVADGADVVITYALGGYAHDGFDSLAKAADSVLAEQIDGLKKYLDRTTGRGG